MVEKAVIELRIVVKTSLNTRDGVEVRLCGFATIQQAAGFAFVTLTY